jgi:hypothetical protein
MYSPVGSGRFTSFGVNEDELRDRAFKALLPGIRPRLSLLNSLYELKDFKTLSHTFRNLAKLPAKGGSLTLRKVLRKAVQNTSDVYLQYMFNIGPLLSDICNIQRSLKQTRSQVNKLLENEGKRTIVRYGHRVESPVYANSSLALMGHSIGQNYIDRPSELIGTGNSYRTVTADLQFRAQMEYNYTLPGWQRHNAQLLGLLDSLGVQLNPQIIWNALPWSFVIDWVADVGQWLSQFSNANLKPVTMIHRFCWSLHGRRTISCSKDLMIGTPYARTGIPVSTIREEAYIRSPSRPDMVSALTGSGISLTEFSLAAALGGSRLR